MQDKVQKDPREVSWDRSALDPQGDQKWVIAEKVVKGQGQDQQSIDKSNKPQSKLGETANNEESQQI